MAKKILMSILLILVGLIIFFVIPNNENYYIYDDTLYNDYLQNINK